MGRRYLSKRRNKVSKRRNKVSKRRNKVSKRRNKVSKRGNKISKRRNKVSKRRLFKYGGSDTDASDALPIDLSDDVMDVVEQTKNYLIYFDDKLDYFTKGSMNFEPDGDWYGLSSTEQGGIYRKIINENNEIIGIPVCCNQVENPGLEHPYYIYGSNWEPQQKNTDNILWAVGVLQSEHSSIPKEMFVTLLEACKKCKEEEPNSTINLAFDWDQNLSKFEGLPVRAPNGADNYESILNLYRGLINEDHRNALMGPSVMCDFLFNGVPVDLDELNQEGSRRHIIQRVLTELWNEGVGIVIISNSFSENKLANSGPKMFMNIMFEMGIWKNNSGVNFNIDNDEIRQLCLIGNKNSYDDSWKVNKLGQMMIMNTFEQQKMIKL
jgi:hypothetical protein